MLDGRVLDGGMTMKRGDITDQEKAEKEGTSGEE